MSSTLNPKHYTPEISPGNSKITPPPATGPTLTNEPCITLTYPYVSPTTTLLLKRPQIGDKDTVVARRVENYTIGGQFRPYRDSSWPTYRIFDYEISRMPAEEADNLRAFIILTLGKLIGLLDYEGQQWQGILLNPNTAIKQLARDECSYDAHLSFELTPP